MELILLERVRGLGLMGDTVKVKDGYGRNYLLPRGLALRATATNLKTFENKKKEFEAKNLQLKAEAEAVAKKMVGTSLVLIRHAGDTGQLYGSVTAKDIASAMDEKGFKVSRTQVHIPQPIKELGISKVQIHLHAEVEVDVTVNVALSEEEAQMQFAKATKGEEKAAPKAKKAEVEATAEEIEA